MNEKRVINRRNVIIQSLEDLGYVVIDNLSEGYITVVLRLKSNYCLSIKVWDYEFIKPDVLSKTIRQLNETLKNDL